ncbi:MAG TPA: hypothetical protein VGK73_06595, partial [Polyangiaceae bacterium]
PVGAHTCESVDPACPGSLARRPPADGGGGACDGSDCTAEVVIVEYFGCSCRDSGWTCVPASLGGGR